jgi:hypothetical protein
LKKRRISRKKGKFNMTNISQTASNELGKSGRKPRKTMSSQNKAPEPRQNIFDHVHELFRRSLKPRNELEEELSLQLLNLLWQEHYFKLRYGTANLKPDQRKSHAEVMALLDAGIGRGLKAWSALKAMPASRAFTLPAGEARGSSRGKTARRRRPKSSPKQRPT